jgi:hypothetical protein
MVNADPDKSILVKTSGKHPEHLGAEGSVHLFFLSDPFPGKRIRLKKQLFGSHTLD